MVIYSFITLKGFIINFKFFINLPLVSKCLSVWPSSLLDSNSSHFSRVVSSISNWTQLEWHLTFAVSSKTCAIMSGLLSPSLCLFSLHLRGEAVGPRPWRQSTAESRFKAVPVCLHHANSDTQRQTRPTLRFWRTYNNVRRKYYITLMIYDRPLKTVIVSSCLPITISLLVNFVTTWYRLKSSDSVPLQGWPVENA